MITIERGIPLPKAKTVKGARRNRKYPVLAMDVGDSFFVAVNDDTREDFEETHKYLRNAMQYYKRTHGICTLCNPDYKDGLPGVRIWRIEDAR